MSTVQNPKENMTADMQTMSTNTLKSSVITKCHGIQLTPWYNNADRIAETAMHPELYCTLEAYTFEEIRKLWQLIITSSIYRICFRFPCGANLIQEN